jgi:hypothetical protein
MATAAVKKDNQHAEIVRSLNQLGGMQMIWDV